MSESTYKVLRTDPKEDDFGIQPGEAMLRFSNREAGTQKGEMVLVINREGMDAQALHEMPLAQRRAYVLWDMLTRLPHGQTILAAAVEYADAMEGGDALGSLLKQVEPKGHA